MTVYEITGFQSPSAPHWEYALIEAESPDDARAALLIYLTSGEHETVWGWGEQHGTGWQDPTTWRVNVAAQPLLFVLGGGCR